jgi:cytochrome b561
LLLAGSLDLSPLMPKLALLSPYLSLRIALCNLIILSPGGILILILVVIRFVNRRFSTLPPFPATMSSQERFIAHASEMLLYTLLFVQPLVGWAMLSAARYPIVLYGPLHLFPILPHSVMLYAALRKAHTVLAYLLFLAFIAHFGAVLFHTLILRDRLFSRIAPYRVPAR